jgi:hypothetical protein
MTDNSALDFNSYTSPHQGVMAVSHTSSESTIDIATLSNIYDVNLHSENYDSLIELNEFELSYIDFVSCFYSQHGGHFAINSLNKHFKPLLLNHQTYNTTDNKKFSWNIYHQCLKAYGSKHNVSENVISPFKKIALSKETFASQSLATNSGYQQTLSWDHIINTLVSNGQIRYTGDIDHNASVVFKLFYVFYSKALDVKIAAIFKYRSTIPCYRNVYGNPEHFIPSVYSKAESSSNTIVNSVSEEKQKLKSTYFEQDDDNTTMASLMTKQLINSFKEDDDDEEDDNDSHEDGGHW